jgi:hypothetical protein
VISGFEITPQNHTKITPKISNFVKSHPHTISLYGSVISGVILWCDYANVALEWYCRLVMDGADTWKSWKSI